MNTESTKPIWREGLRDRVMAFLEKARMTNKEFADLTGISPSYVSVLIKATETPRIGRDKMARIEAVLSGNISNLTSEQFVTMEEFARLVRQARTAKGWSQNNLMEETNRLLDKEYQCSRQWLANLENGLLKRKMLPIRAKTMCTVLEISPLSVRQNDTEVPDEIGPFNCMPLVKQLASMNLGSLSVEQFLALCRSNQMLEEAGLPVTLIPTHQQ